jgi:hypothetical protein
MLEIEISDGTPRQVYKPPASIQQQSSFTGVSLDSLPIDFSKIKRAVLACDLAWNPDAKP